jgi:hypothetical protein
MIIQGIENLMLFATDPALLARVSPRTTEETSGSDGPPHIDSAKAAPLA